jgi:hypothetical protein
VSVVAQLSGEYESTPDEAVAKIDAAVVLFS